jgi:hypothetical protein
MALKNNGLCIQKSNEVKHETRTTLKNKGG